MFLSKVVIDPRYAFAYRLTQNPAALHSLVQTRPFATAQKDNRVLYRLVSDYDRYVLYVQSDVLPDWGRVTGNGVRLEAVRNIDKIQDLFTNGAVLGFTLLANTVYSKSSRNSKDPNVQDHRSRIFITTEEERREWLDRQAEKSGFEIVKANENNPNEEKRNVVKRDGRSFYLSAVEFNGVLRITDKDLFAKAFHDGIGRAKAYGCGMLMLRKAA